MNNCPKCGNPLQVGISSCPICGTNIEANNETQNKSNTVTVTSVSKPAENKTPVASVESPKKEEAVSVSQTVTQNTASNNNIEKTSAPVSSEAQIKAEPSQDNKQVAVTSDSKVNQVIEQAVPVQPVQQSQSAIQPAQQVQPAVQPTVQPIAQPTVQPVVTTPQVEQPTPVQANVAPSIPLSLEVNDPAAIQAVRTLTAELKPEVQTAPKKKANKNVIIIAAFLVLLLVAGGFYFMQGSKTKMKNNNNNNQAQKEIAATTLVSSNGYKFNLPEGWLINEDGKNVILTNAGETVVVKLDHSKSNLSYISKETIEKYLSNSSYENGEVTEVQISAKDAYAINTNINDLPVQIYFISGGSNLIIGATIIYQSEDTKTKYEPSVTELLGTLSFSDESIKAISTMDTYSDIFNIYGGIINSQTSIQNPETPNTENSTPETENNEAEKPNTEGENENNTTPTE